MGVIYLRSLPSTLPKTISNFKGNSFNMEKQKLKKELVELIENTNDEELLSLLKEDFTFYGNIKNKDITDQLSSEQLKELEMLVNEDELKDTVTLDEFTKATTKWRLK